MGACHCFAEIESSRASSWRAVAGDIFTAMNKEHPSDGYTIKQIKTTRVSRSHQILQCQRNNLRRLATFQNKRLLRVFDDLGRPLLELALRALRLGLAANQEEYLVETSRIQFDKSSEGQNIF